jgi:prepilin signal peptidase PulO-like enzyme (type II secretory pathway)
MGWVLPHVAEVNLWHIVLFAVLGLVIGSFLNVLIYRLPLMILRNEEPEKSYYLQHYPSDQ